MIEASGRGGLQDDGGPGRQRGEGRSGGDRDGEVPRRRDQGQRCGREGGAVDVVERGRQGAVEVREVDRLGHLGIGLVDGLAGLRRHDLDERGAVRLECVADGVQHRATRTAGPGPPDRTGGLGAAERGVERRGGVDPGLLDGADAERRRGDPCGDGVAPGADGADRGVAVRGVLEVAGAGAADRGVPVGDTV
jgi:hypothetical protein